MEKGAFLGGELADEALLRPRIEVTGAVRRVGHLGAVEAPSKERPEASGGRCSMSSSMGVSLALNYRAQFDQIILRSSYDTLLHRIKSKAEEGSSWEHMEKLGIMPRRATPRPPCRGTIA
jgi:hypothetical protein